MAKVGNIDSQVTGADVLLVTNPDAPTCPWAPNPAAWDDRSSTVALFNVTVTVLPVGHGGSAWAS
jgi:hypothetical protein